MRNFVGTFTLTVDTEVNKVSLPLEWVEDLKKRTLYYQKIENTSDDGNVNIQYNFYCDKSKVYHKYKIYLTRINSEGELLLPLDFPFFNKYQQTLLLQGRGPYFVIYAGNKPKTTHTIDFLINLFEEK